MATLEEEINKELQKRKERAQEKKPIPTSQSCEEKHANQFINNKVPAVLKSKASFVGKLSGLFASKNILQKLSIPPRSKQISLPVPPVDTHAQLIQQIEMYKTGCHRVISTDDVTEMKKDICRESISADILKYFMETMETKLAIYFRECYLASCSSLDQYPIMNPSLKELEVIQVSKLLDFNERDASKLFKNIRNLSAEIVKKLKTREFVNNPIQSLQKSDALVMCYINNLREFMTQKDNPIFSQSTIYKKDLSLLAENLLKGILPELTQNWIMISLNDAAENTSNKMNSLRR